jgi:hypothetical protein
MQLVMTVELRAQRNPVYIAGTYLQVAGAEVWGYDTGSERVRDARLAEGQKLLRSWALTDVRHLPANKRWEIGWQDSDGKRHRLAIVAKQDVRRLTSELTEAEGTGAP